MMMALFNEAFRWPCDEYFRCRFHSCDLTLIDFDTPFERFLFSLSIAAVAVRLCFAGIISGFHFQSRPACSHLNYPHYAAAAITVITLCADIEAVINMLSFRYLLPHEAGKPLGLCRARSYQDT